MGARSSAASGLLFAVGAYVWWGFFPLYFRLLADTPAFEILLHRSIWSVPILLLLVLVRRQFPAIRAALRDRRARRVLLASAVLLAANWFTLIAAINGGHVLECSLGYYINPLLTVALGVLVLRERLSRLQAVALLLAAAGVLVLAWQGDRFPWYALSLALTFGLYGLLRKTMRLGSAEGLLAETLLMLPFALGALIWLAAAGEARFGRLDLAGSLLLMSSGLATCVPLLLFAGGARRLTLSTLGIVQYIAPTLHFLTAVFLFGEVFTTAHSITFALIWVAVLLFVLENWRQRPRAAAQGAAMAVAGR